MEAKWKLFEYLCVFCTALGGAVWTCVSVLWSCVVSCTRHGHWTADVGHKCCWCARLELCKTINTAGKRPRKTFDFGHNCFLLQLKLCCIPWQNWGIKACGECYQWLLFDELLLDQGLPAFGGFGVLAWENSCAIAGVVWHSEGDGSFLLL